MPRPRSARRVLEARRLLDAAMKQLDRAGREQDAGAKLKTESTAVADDLAAAIERLDRISTG